MPQVKGYRNNRGDLAWGSENDAPILRRYGHGIGVPPGLAKRLKAALPLWLPHYATSFRQLSADTLTLLGSISAAIIDRLLKPIRAKAGHRGLSGTKPGALLKKHIPIQAGVWNVTQPGFIEADTVAHCGDSLAGDFVWGLTMTASAIRG